MPGPSPRLTALLRAATTLVARQGLRGLTHRGVDREAGLPEGTCSAYLRTRHALVTALAGFVSEHFLRDLEALTAELEALPDPAAHALPRTRDLLLHWLEEPDVLVVRIELSLEGTREPDVAVLMERQYERLVEVVEHALVTSGREHGRDRAVTLIAALDGLLLRALREPADDRTRVLGSSAEMLLTSLTGA